MTSNETYREVVKTDRNLYGKNHNLGRKQTSNLWRDSKHVFQKSPTKFRRKIEKKSFFADRGMMFPFKGKRESSKYEYGDKENI